MAGGDWLRLYRRSLDSRVFSDDWLWRLWCWCLMRAAWKTHHRGAVSLQPGEFATGRHEASKELGVSPSRLWRGLQTLASWGQIVLKPNSRFTVISICNWTTYQNEEDEQRTMTGQSVDSEWTASGQPADSQRTLIEEGKKVRKEEGKKSKSFCPPTLDEVAAYCRERDNHVDAESFHAYYQSNGWKVGKNPMRDWKAAVRTWEKNEDKFNGKGAANGAASGQKTFEQIFAENEARFPHLKTQSREARNDVV